MWKDAIKINRWWRHRCSNFSFTGNMCLGAAHARFKRARAHLRLQRLGHSKFRRSFVKREPNLLLDERLPSFINFLSDPSDIEHRIEFCGVTYFFFVSYLREREREKLNFLVQVSLIRSFGNDLKKRKMNEYIFLKQKGSLNSLKIVYSLYK